MTHARIPAGTVGGRVIPLNLELRTFLEFDVEFMRDRIRTEVMANGRPTGAWAVMTFSDYDYPFDPVAVVGRYGPEIEAQAVQAFMGADDRERLGREVERLSGEVERLREAVFRPGWLRRQWNRLNAWASARRA